MRRSLLTRTTGFGPVGGASTASFSQFAPTGAVWGGTPAGTSGTVTSVSADFGGAATIRFFVIRNVAGTWTIQAATGDLTSVVGIHAYSVSLAMASGDYLGFWQTTGASLWYDNTGSGTYQTTVTGTKPAAAVTYSVGSTQNNYTYAFVGT